MMAAGRPGQDAPTAPLLRDVERYYSAKLRRYGPNALGVDWNSPMSQRLRFVQLLKVVDWTTAPLTLHDLGCGYGALLDHLLDRHPDAAVAYVGTDLSHSMIGHARRNWSSNHRARFELADSAMPQADYTIASGIFNVCLGHPEADWEHHIATTLTRMRAATHRGFAVNFMTHQALVERPAAIGQLYATTPEHWISYCVKNLRCEVQCVQNYGLNEFTLLAASTS